MRPLWRRLQWLLHRDQFERELDEELRYHRELTSGHFGNTTLVKEESRAMWTGVFWEQFAQDVRYGLRAMWSNKLFASMAILSLALGIGANTAIYSFVEAILLRSLPVSHPEQLVILKWRAQRDSPIVHGHWGESYDEPGGAEVSPNYPFPAYELLRDKNDVLSSLFGHVSANRLNILIDGEAELADCQYVTGNFFSSLGVRAMIGRLIGREDDRTGASPVAVITNDYWRSRFAGNPNVIGKTLQINGVIFTIAGVAAPEFFGVSPGTKPALFLPVANIGLTDSRPNWPVQMRDGTFYWIELMGRLKPGITITQAQAHLAALFQGFVQNTITKERERHNLPVVSLQEGGSGFDSLRRTYSRTLWILMVMVGLILAIACANIANLLLARASARRREMAVRLSLGAGRLRVIRQLLTESVMLSVVSCPAALAIAALAIRFLRLLITNGRDDFSVEITLDWHVLSFTLLVAFATGLLFGLAPALQGTKVDVTPALKESRASAVTGRTRRFGFAFGLGHILVVSQIAICLMLVAAAGLFVRTLANLHAVNIGFNSQNILVFGLDASKAGYKGAALKQLYAELRQRMRAIPGVRGATLSDMPLVAGSSSSTNINVPGIPKPPEGQRGPATSFMQVGPEFFDTMKIPIVLGRAIDDGDVEDRQPVAVVNELFASKYFPGVNPLGRHFQLGDGKDSDLEIVGVAKSALYSSLKREIPPVTYISFRQSPARARSRPMVFELRTSVDPLALAGAVRQIVHRAAPQVPVSDLTTEARMIDGTILQERTFAALCSCFGVLALAMACVGLYGSMAYAVARRTGEIGIRMALGAERRRVIWIILREVIALLGAGMSVGILLASRTTVLLKSFLFGLKPDDPSVLAGSVAILVTCAIAAGYAPAWRASRIDPMAALRHE
jgi:macrolide transport system ATP-binding/permease protein